MVGGRNIKTAFGQTNFVDFGVEWLRTLVQESPIYFEHDLSVTEASRNTFEILAAKMVP